MDQYIKSIDPGNISLALVINLSVAVHCIPQDNKRKARNLVVGNLLLKTKGSRFESGC